MLEREVKLGRDTSILRVESGLGASGIPHVGSLGDAVRAYGVKLALQDLGYKSELIAYSDDMDGLRKIPEGFPKSLSEHLAKPVSFVPDADGCHNSYGEHMSSLLLEGLDDLGIQYEFRRAYDTYSRGDLTEQIHAILSQRESIGKKIADMVGQEKFTKYLPYYAVCADCKRLYTTESLEYDGEKRAISYVCKDAEIGGNLIKGCGHEGVSRIGVDLGKLAWKVEFAARWAAYDIRFEAYGKDIMDSVHVNDWVAENILGYAPPHHVKYEMFLDRRGKKISKSLGNVITSQRWLKYGTKQSLLLLLYKRITGARELGFEDIPSLMDEYHELEVAYFSDGGSGNAAKDAKMRGLYEYVNLLKVPSAPSQHVKYMLLVELARIFVEDRTERVIKKLLDYKTIKESSVEIERLVQIAGNYADDFARMDTQSVDAQGSVRDALLSLADSLESDPDSVENAAYEAAKSAGAKPRDVFVCMYQILLGSASGPRLGPFMADIGLQRWQVNGDYKMVHGDHNKNYEKKSSTAVFIMIPMNHLTLVPPLSYLPPLQLQYLP